MTRVKMKLDIRVPDKFRVSTVEAGKEIVRFYEKIVYPSRDNAEAYVVTTVQDPGHETILTKEEVALIFITYHGAQNMMSAVYRKTGERWMFNNLGIDGKDSDYGFDIVG